LVLVQLNIGKVMLITTSRRPCHLTRILSRELARVLPRSVYIPRGAKTIEKITSLARELGQNRVIIVNSTLDKPGEVRFLEVGEVWRWADASVRLGEVKVPRRAVRGSDINVVKIFAVGAEALEFAEWVEKFLGLGRSDVLPDSGLVIFITSRDGLKIQFRIMPGAQVVGPELAIASFGNLSGGRSAEMRGNDGQSRKSQRDDKAGVQKCSRS